MLSSRLVALLQRVSRSFYLSIRVLPAAVQAQVALGYLLARAADTVADTPLLPAAVRAEVLAELRLAVSGKSPGPLLQRLRELESAARALPTSATAAAEQELLTVLGECLILLRQLAPDDQRLIERVLDQLAHGMTVVTRNTVDFAGMGVPLINPWDTWTLQEARQGYAATQPSQ